MKKEKIKRIVPVVLIIVVSLIALFAIWLLGRAIFKPGKKENTQSQISVAREALLSAEVSRGTTMTVRGPITADETFKTYQLTIKPNERRMVTYEGYLGAVINSKDYTNNTAAYEEFVYALDKAQMVNANPLEGADDDTRGVCAAGRLIEFDLTNNGASNYHLWTSTCKGSPGSFRASSEQIRSLFMKQIPDASALLKEAKINF